MNSFREYCMCLKEIENFDSFRGKYIISKKREVKDLFIFSFFTLIISLCLTYFLFVYGFKDYYFELINIFLFFANILIVLINITSAIATCIFITKLYDINIEIKDRFENYNNLKNKKNQYQNNKEYIDRFETSFCHSKYLKEIYNNKDLLTSDQIKILISLIDENKKSLDLLDEKIRLDVINESMLILND